MEDFNFVFFFFQAEDGIRDKLVTGVQTCALPISSAPNRARSKRASMTAIISIAQQASPNCIGQIEERRAQLMTESTVVVRTLSPKRLSTSPMMFLRPDLSHAQSRAL